MTADQAAHQAELVAFFLHDDQEPDDNQGPYGPGVTARATAAANAALRECELCTSYGREHDSHCTDI